ncbi:MAG: hypothetical protein R2712_07380 [Vicinamibacterales bacterium]
MLTAWNGLMIAAAARAGRVLDGGAWLAQPDGMEESGARHLAVARRAATFIERR